MADEIKERKPGGYIVKPLQGFRVASRSHGRKLSEPHAESVTEQQSNITEPIEELQLRGPLKTTINLSTLNIARLLILVKDSETGKWLVLTKDGSFSKVSSGLEEVLNDVETDEGKTGEALEIQPQTDLPERNRQLSAMLDAWISEPDDKGDEWWDEFEADLKKNRLTFREIDPSEFGE